MKLVFCKEIYSTGCFFSFFLHKTGLLSQNLLHLVACDSALYMKLVFGHKTFDTVVHAMVSMKLVFGHEILETVVHAMLSMKLVFGHKILETVVHALVSMKLVFGHGILDTMVRALLAGPGQDGEGVGAGHV